LVTGEKAVDSPHDELLKLTQAYVKEVTPIVREQERILGSFQNHTYERLFRRLRLTVAVAADVIAEQEDIIQHLDDHS
jgi:hypothetical protein